MFIAGKLILSSLLISKEGLLFGESFKNFIGDLSGKTLDGFYLNPKRPYYDNSFFNEILFCLLIFIPVNWVILFSLNKLLFWA